MKLLLLISSIVILSSCKKGADPNDQNNPVTPAEGSIEYRVNGNLFTIDNTKMLDSEYVTIRKEWSANIPTTRYIINEQKDANNFMAFTILTDSLLLANYHYDSIDQRNNAPTFSFNLGYNGLISSLFFNGDYLDVNISSYKNGRVSGTFTGKATPYSFTYGYGIKNSFVITEGKLNNIPVTY